MIAYRGVVGASDIGSSDPGWLLQAGLVLHSHVPGTPAGLNVPWLALLRRCSG